jgi:hypothetical protein
MTRSARYVYSYGPGIMECAIRSLPSCDDQDVRAVVRANRRQRSTKVREFSRHARINMRKRALSYPWDELGRLVLITLTYPLEFPRDGREVKSHARRLWKRWARHWGEAPRGMWVLEFQDLRGAPHLHVFIQAPAGVEDDELEWWGFNVWSEIVGFDNYGYVEITHRQQRLRFNVSGAWWANNRTAVEVASYMWRHSGKIGQKTIPEDFVNVGKFWGVLDRKNLRQYRGEFCCEDSYLAFRRVAIRLSERRLGRKLRTYNRGIGGTFAQLVNGLYDAPRLVAWAVDNCGCRGLW